MTILHGADAIERFKREYAEALEIEQSELSPEQFLEEVRHSAYQEKFCEVFAEYAPTAWAELNDLQQTAIMWLDAEFVSKDPKRAAMWHKLMLTSIRAWTERYRLNAQWVQFSALMTVRAIAYYKVGQIHSEPATLLYNEFPTMVIDDGMVEIGILRGKLLPESWVLVNPDQGPLEWDTLQETRAEFRKRALAAYQAELDAQLDRVEAPVLSKSDIEAHAHHIIWTVQRYAGKRSIRSLADEWRTSRPGISKGINSSSQRLGLPQLPESWGATRTK